jgi:hypothetical protein
MPRLRFRLSNLVMLLIIIAMGLAMSVQWRREMALRAQLEALQAESLARARIEAQYRVVRNKFLDVLEEQALIERLDGTMKDEAGDSSK